MYYKGMMVVMVVVVRVRSLLLPAISCPLRRCMACGMPSLSIIRRPPFSTTACLASPLLMLVLIPILFPPHGWYCFMDHQALVYIVISIQRMIVLGGGRVWGREGGGRKETNWARKEGRETRRGGVVVVVAASR